MISHHFSRCLSSTWPIPIVQGIAKLVYKGYNQDLWYWLIDKLLGHHIVPLYLQWTISNQEPEIMIFFYILRSRLRVWQAHFDTLAIMSECPSDLKWPTGKSWFHFGKSWITNHVFVRRIRRISSEDLAVTSYNASMMSPRSLELLEQHS